MVRKPAQTDSYEEPVIIAFSEDIQEVEPEETGLLHRLGST